MLYFVFSENFQSAAHPAPPFNFKTSKNGRVKDFFAYSRRNRSFLGILKTIFIPPPLPQRPKNKIIMSDYFLQAFLTSKNPRNRQFWVQKLTNISIFEGILPQMCVLWTTKSSLKPEITQMFAYILSKNVQIIKYHEQYLFSVKLFVHESFTGRIPN